MARLGLRHRLGSVLKCIYCGQIPSLLLGLQVDREKFERNPRFWRWHQETMGDGSVGRKRPVRGDLGLYQS